MRKIIFLLAILCSFAWQAVNAQKQVTGQVTSAEDGFGIPGVNVIVKGTTFGTATDNVGNFTIEANSTDVLLFTSLGMVTQEILIGEKNVINVVMETESVDVDEVIVTALGIKRNKKALGYAVTEFKSADLEDVQVIDAASALQGKVAGVSISSSSGAPGASMRVLVRGVTSMTGSNQPLYIVNGVPVNNGVSNANSTDPEGSVNRTVDFGNAASDINPDDIESISVLKGASATALYGSRAANGVIIINTKSGAKNQALKVRVSSSSSVMEVGRLPYYQEKFGQGWSGHAATMENGSWGPELDGKDRLIGNVVDNFQRVQPFEFQEDGLRDFFEYGYTLNNTISLSGGTKNMGYLLSYTNTKSDGVIPGDVDVLDRNSVAFKANGGNENTKIDFSVNYTNKQLSAVATGQGDLGGGGRTVFQQILWYPNNHYLPEYRDYNYKFDNLDNFFNRYGQNLYSIINENKSELKQDRIISSINISQKLYDGLDVSWRGGLDTYSYLYKDYGAIAEITPGTPNDGTKKVHGLTKEEARRVSQLNSDLIITYTGKIGDLNYTAVLGNNINQRSRKRLTVISKGLVVPKYYNIANISGSADVSTNEMKRRLIGVYGQMDFSYKNYLFLQLLGRNDWSSTLPEGDNSFFYPGINAGLIFTELMDKKTALSYGKLRASYATVGNDADPYQLSSTYRVARIRAGGFGLTNYPVGGVPAYEKSGTLGNPSLKPEISKEFEIGADLRFFNNRIGFDFAYYKKVTTDLIMTANIAASSGFYWQTSNLGQITNDGIEIKLDLTPIKTNNFEWNLTTVFNKYNTVLDELAPELGVSEYVIIDIYDTEFVAIPGEQLGQFRIPGYKRTPDGKIIVGGNGLPLEGDKETVGSSVPDYAMSITNNLSYKGFKFSALIDYQKGGMMYSNTSGNTFWSGNGEQSITNNRRPYVVPNSVQQLSDGTYVENSTPINNNWHEYYESNTNKPIERNRLIEKTYIKLRELSLSYNINKSFVERAGLSTATVSLYGRNLFLWTPADNSFIDPETATSGNDLMGMFGEFNGAPSVRTYGFKLNLSF